MEAINLLADKCKKCCKGKGVYVNCVKPIEGYFQCPHDPMFPDDDEWEEERRNRVREFWNDWWWGFKKRSVNGK